MNEQRYALAKENGPVEMFLTLKGETLATIRAMQPDFPLVAEVPLNADVESHWFQSDVIAVRVYDPLDEPVTRHEINTIWASLEQAPIEVFGSSFDCKAEPDEKRMLEAIEFWDQGAVPYWKTADNQQYELANKQALIDLYNEMRKLRRVRGQLLFNQAQQFKADIDSVTRRDLKTAGWI